MKHDKIDRILTDDPTLEPSSGFADSIMEAVRREAETPAPLSFPWRRVAPGLTVCLIAVVAAAIAALTGNAGTSTPGTALLDGLESSLLVQSALETPLVLRVASVVEPPGAQGQGKGEGRGAGG